MYSQLVASRSLLAQGLPSGTQALHAPLCVHASTCSHECFLGGGWGLDHARCSVSLPHSPPPIASPTSTHMGVSPMCARLQMPILPLCSMQHISITAPAPHRYSSSAAHMYVHGHIPNVQASACVQSSSDEGRLDHAHCRVSPLLSLPPMPCPSATQMGKPPKWKRPLVSSVPWMGG